MALIDKFHRKIDYLRISITDHCNLNCKYCSPPFSGRTHLQRQEILTYEEIATLAEAAVAAGIARIRLTGGEPLIRNGVVDLCRMLSEINGLESLSLTTNGVRLGSLAEPLLRAGVHRINVSLDSLKPNRFAQITGQDSRSQDVSRAVGGNRETLQGSARESLNPSLFSARLLQQLQVDGAQAGRDARVAGETAGRSRRPRQKAKS